MTPLLTFLCLLTISAALGGGIGYRAGFAAGKKHYGRILS